MGAPLRAWMPPSTIRAVPKARPPATAQRVAFTRSPVARHATARKIRPPSMGNPGIKLKIASARLMNER